MTLQLRDYQQDAIDSIGAKFQQGIWSQIIVLPTGSGKTECFARLRFSALGPWLDAYPPREQKILVIAHREELIEQAAQKFARANPDLNIGIEKSDRRASWLLDDVIVGSVQTLQGKRLAAIDPAQVRIVIIDEAHHAAADTYQALLRHFNLLPPAELKPSRKQKDFAQARQVYQRWWAEPANHPGRVLLGVTATPNRGDAIGLEWTFQGIVFERSLRWMIERQYLAPLRGFLVDTQLSLDDVKITAGDFNQGQLAQTVNTFVRNRAAAIAWGERCRLPSGAARRTLAFTVDIQHAKDLAAAFAYLPGNVRAEWVSGDDPERATKIERFRRGAIDVLCNAQLLTEGFDLPDISAILMAKPTTSQALYCLSNDTEILTATGWVGIDDVIIDRPFVFEHESGTIREGRCLARIEREIGDAESWVSYRGPQADLRVTDQHRMIWRERRGRRHRRTPWHLGTAIEMAQRPDCVEIPVAGWQDAPGLCIPDDELRFLGLILTDGSVNASQGQATIYQSAASPVVSEIRRILLSIGVKHTEHEIDRRGIGHRFEPTAPSLSWTISKGVPRIRDKHLCGWGALAVAPLVGKQFEPVFERLSGRELRHVLDGMQLGDGVKSRRSGWKIVISKRRRVLADRLQSLCVRRGLSASLLDAHATAWYLAIEDCVARTIPTTKSDRPCVAVTQARGERVWCIETDTGTIITRRNGRVAIVGNCQMIGRGTRLAPGKPDCIVLDVVDASSRHSLASLGDLFGLPAKFDLNGADALDTAQLVERLQAENPEATITGSTIEAVRKAIAEFDLWTVRESEAVQRFARLTWVEDSAQRYHIPLPARSVQGAIESEARQPAERITLQETMLGGWEIAHVVGFEQRPLNAADDLPAAFQRAERWIENYRPDVMQMKSRDAKWLGKKPSDKQRALLQKFKSPRWDDPKLTRGEASALLDQAFARKGRRPYWQQPSGQREAKVAIPPAPRGQRAIDLGDEPPF